MYEGTEAKRKSEYKEERGQKGYTEECRETGIE